MTPTAGMSTVSMEMPLSFESGSNGTTAKPPPAGDGDDDHHKTDSDSTTISVAASASSLILVLVAIVIWYFLVRRQLLSKAKSHQRLGSHKSHRSNPGSRQNSFRDSRHDSILSHKEKNHHGSRHSPKSHKSSFSPKCHHRHSSNHDVKDVCTCPKSFESPAPGRCSPPKNGSPTECTGNSPFCPHSNRFTYADHKARNSVHSDLSDHACGPVEAICTCEMEKGQTKIISGANFTVVELEAHNKRQMTAQEPADNGHILRAQLEKLPLSSVPAHQQPTPQCTCPHPLNAITVGSPKNGPSHLKMAQIQNDSGVIGSKGNGDMV